METVILGIIIFGLFALFFGWFGGIIERSFGTGWVCLLTPIAFFIGIPLIFYIIGIIISILSGTLGERELPNGYPVSMWLEDLKENIIIRFIMKNWFWIIIVIIVLYNLYDIVINT